MIGKFFLLAVIIASSLYSDILFRTSDVGQGVYRISLISDKELAVNKNWIGVYPQEASNEWKNVKKWTWVKDMVKDRVDYEKYPNYPHRYSIKFDCSDLTPGDYEARLFFNNSYTVEKRAKMKIDSSDETLSLYKEQNNLLVISSNKLDRPKGWIGIYKKGASVEWKNVQLWQWRKSTGRNNFDISSLEAGSYEARLFFNNSYNVEVTQEFSVDENDLDFSFIYDWKGRGVEFTATAIKSKSWIGIYEKGASNEWKNVKLWSWAKEPNHMNVIASFDKEKLSVLDYDKAYEARLFYNNSFKTEAVVPFKRWKPTLNKDDSGFYKYYDYENNRPDKVRNLYILFSDNDEGFIKKDWIAIYKKGDKRIGSNIIDWAYTTDPRFGFNYKSYRWKFPDIDKYKEGTTYVAVLYSNDTYNEIDSVEIKY